MCATGYYCSEFSVCVELCNDEDPCTDDRICVGMEHSEVGVFDCSDSCRPGQGDCPIGRTCIHDFIDGIAATFCEVEGDVGEGDSCVEDQNQCAPGLVCRGDRCYRYCRSSSSCSPGECLFWEDPPLVIGGDEYGVCSL